MEVEYLRKLVCFKLSDYDGGKMKQAQCFISIWRFLSILKKWRSRLEKKIIFVETNCERHISPSQNRFHSRAKLTASSQKQFESQTLSLRAGSCKVMAYSICTIMSRFVCRDSIYCIPPCTEFHSEKFYTHFEVCCFHLHGFRNLWQEILKVVNDKLRNQHCLKPQRN